MVYWEFTHGRRSMHLVSRTNSGSKLALGRKHDFSWPVRFVHDLGVRTSQVHIVQQFEEKGRVAKELGLLYFVDNGVRCLNAIAEAPTIQKMFFFDADGRRLIETYGRLSDTAREKTVEVLSFHDIALALKLLSPRSELSTAAWSGILSISPPHCPWPS